MILMVDAVVVDVVAVLVMDDVCQKWKMMTPKLLVVESTD